MEENETTPVPDTKAAGPGNTGLPTVRNLAMNSRNSRSGTDGLKRPVSQARSGFRQLPEADRPGPRSNRYTMQTSVLPWMSSRSSDNLERALKSDDNHLREGVEQIHQLLSGILVRHGITPIDALKRPFDPGEHEAVAHIPSDDAEGTVVDVVSARGTVCMKK